MKHRQLQRKEERENKRAKAPSWEKKNYILKMYFCQLKEQGRDFQAWPGKIRGVCYLNKLTEEDRDSGMSPEQQL